MRASILLSEVILVTSLITVTGPDKQPIELNPVDVVSLREPSGRVSPHQSVNCLIFTLDSKFIGVIETCAEVKQRMRDANPELSQ
jgi:hypothetical protein